MNTLTFMKTYTIILLRKDTVIIQGDKIEKSKSFKICKVKILKEEKIWHRVDVC